MIPPNRIQPEALPCLGDLVFDTIYDEKGGGHQLQHHDCDGKGDPPIRQFSRVFSVAHVRSLHRISSNWVGFKRLLIGTSAP
jgi:hypothetical protein